MGLADEAARRIAAVTEAPDDLASRWALAAWLRERGNPLGAFIDLQLERYAAESRTARPHPQPSAAEIATAESGNFDGGFATSAEQVARYHKAKSRGLI